MCSETWSPVGRRPRGEHNRPDSDLWSGPARRLPSSSMREMMWQGVNPPPAELSVVDWVGRLSLPLPGEVGVLDQGPHQAEQMERVS